MVVDAQEMVDVFTALVFSEILAQTAFEADNHGKMGQCKLSNQNARLPARHNSHFPPEIHNFVHQLDWKLTRKMESLLPTAKGGRKGQTKETLFDAILTYIILIITLGSLVLSLIALGMCQRVRSLNSSMNHA